MKIFDYVAILGPMFIPVGIAVVSISVDQNWPVVAIVTLAAAATILTYIFRPVPVARQRQDRTP